MSERGRVIQHAERWVIVGRHGLYVGQWLTRREAVADHIKALGKSWAEARAVGDQAVKAFIQWTEP